MTLATRIGGIRYDGEMMSKSIGFFKKALGKASTLKYPSLINLSL